MDRTLQTSLPLFLAALILTAVGGCASDPGPAPGTTEAVLGADRDFTDLAWLSGAWLGEDDRGVSTEEYWTAPRAGTMFGVNRVTADERTVFFEYLRIERADDGGLVYLASPQGRYPPTPFRRVSDASGRLVFENPEHDYPNRIIYRLGSDGTLYQRIEGTENGRPKSGDWKLRRLQ